jgi:ribosome-binding ATPase
MNVALIGLPSSGKSTCFAALTGLEAPAAGVGGRIGTVAVPEPRLDRLAEIHKSKRQVTTEVAFVDTAPLEAGLPGSAVEKHLAQVARDADALALVLQCFGDMNFKGEPLQPAADLENLLLELEMADMGVIERRLEKVQIESKKERSSYEEHLLQRAHAHLEAGKPLHTLELTAEERKVLKGYALITMQPLLVVCNVGDDDLNGARAAETLAFAESKGLPSLVFCATLEAEIAQLAPAEQAEFLQDYGLEASARDRFLRTAYDLLDIMTFLTAGEKETRAWQLARNSTAPQAAGKIHTDLEKGFIRAEVVAFADLDQYGSMAECRKHGLVRLEGKEYIVKEGDVLDIRFSR